MAEVGIVKLQAWPELHRVNREAGIRPPLLPGDPSGPGARWREQTIKTTDASWGRALYFAWQMGWKDVNDVPESFILPDRLREYLKHLRQHNAAATVLHRIVGLERALALVAPSANRKILRTLIANLEEDYEPSSKRERLQEAAALVELGFNLMKLASELPDLKRKQRATMFRDGLEIAFLAMRPVRLKNLSSMRIGVKGHLIPAGDSWTLYWPGHEVKNGKPIEVPFPTALVSAMHEYLNVHRPVLCGDRYAGDALWISYWWRPEHENTIRCQLKKWTEDAFGLPITPHLFRDCAATSLAVHAPEEVQIAHLVLGNTYAVMQKNYNLARVVEAGRHYHNALEQLRNTRPAD
jgi:integrase